MFIPYHGGMPRIVDHAQRRREIVWALWAVIHDRGIDGVTFRAVAAAGGVSIGRVQHYFESREHLIRAGAEHMVAEAELRYRHDGSPTDPRAALVALLTRPVPTDDSGRPGVSVWYAYLAESASDPWIRAFLADATRGTVAETERLLTDLGVPEDVSGPAALRLVAVSNGVTQAVLLGAMDPDVGIGLVTAEADAHTRR